MTFDVVNFRQGEEQQKHHKRSGEPSEFSDTSLLGRNFQGFDSCRIVLSEIMNPALSRLSKSSKMELKSSKMELFGTFDNPEEFSQKLIYKRNWKFQNGT